MQPQPAAFADRVFGSWPGIEAHLRAARVVCLKIPDDHAFMASALVALLEERAGPHLRRLTGGTQPE